MSEQWRAVVGFEDAYEVSSEGRIRALRPRYRTNVGGILAQSVRGRYLHVMMRSRGRGRGFQVHRVVAAAFHGQCPLGLAVNHIDGNRLNNAASNLEYVTASENNRHAIATGLNELQGERHPNAKLRDADVAEIRASYRPKVVTVQMLADRYSVSAATIEDIVRGRRWKHVSTNAGAA